MMTETSITVSPSEGAPHVKSDPGQGQGGASGVSLNLDYFKTVPGILKLLQAFFGVICMAAASPARLSATNWFLFVVIVSFISTVIWIFVYLLSLRDALNKLPINWTLTNMFHRLLSTTGQSSGAGRSTDDNPPAMWGASIAYELLNTIIKTVLYITAFISQLSAWAPISNMAPPRDPNLTAGCFGLFNSIAYAAGVYYLYNDWKYFQGNSGP